MHERFYSVNDFFRKKFSGQKVIKIPIQAHFDCPNKDGTLSSKGCVFCDRYGSGPIRSWNVTIRQQIETFIREHPGRKYIAYYQAHTNTYAPVAELEKKYRLVFSYEDIVGLFVGTRPDAIADEVYPLLDKMKRRIYLSVELGLQSIHEKSLVFLNRNHTYSDFIQTFAALKNHGIDVLVHLIIGIPGETLDDMLATIREINRLKPAGVKFHLFHILKETPLHHLHLQNPLSLLAQEKLCRINRSSNGASRSLHRDPPTDRRKRPGNIYCPSLGSEQNAGLGGYPQENGGFECVSRAANGLDLGVCFFDRAAVHRFGFHDPARSRRTFYLTFFSIKIKPADIHRSGDFQGGIGFYMGENSQFILQKMTISARIQCQRRAFRRVKTGAFAHRDDKSNR